MSEGPTVLVTGGTGFLGGWCVVELLRGGYRVRTTVRHAGGAAAARAAIGSLVGRHDRLSLHVVDLTDDAGWEDAIRGCEYVLHVASPFPATQPKDPGELLVPAREGTLRVLKTSLAADVRRVVVTSSSAAVSGGHARDAAFDEHSWTDPDSPAITPYQRSKTVAELAAWGLVDEQRCRDRLTTIAPGAILGPVMTDDLSYSVQAVDRLLRGMPGIPALGFPFVDVRDVVKAHIAAMTAPEAAGQRYLATGPFAWLSEVAAILRSRLGPAAHKVPRRRLPNLAVRALALFDGGLRTVVDDLDRRVDYSTKKAFADLGWSPRALETTVVECAESLIGQVGRSHA